MRIRYYVSCRAVDIVPVSLACLISRYEVDSILGRGVNAPCVCARDSRRSVRIRYYRPRAIPIQEGTPLNQSRPLLMRTSSRHAGVGGVFQRLIPKPLPGVRRTAQV